MTTKNFIALPEEARALGFVYLHEIDPTIQVSVRYATNENFVGQPVDGYQEPVIILTCQTAQALKEVQAEVAKDGYSLLVYDAYRPQSAPDHFMRWSKDQYDQLKKAAYYPRVNKADIFELGYVAKRSGHSRGSTVDLTLIKQGAQIHDVIVSERVLLNDYQVPFLDDGSIDMGSSFDLCDEASHDGSEVIPEEYQKLRRYLKEVMERHGFKNYAKEWWHFTLRNEPFPADQDSSYFNFPVE